jgi:uncharacterized membrane protein YgdD (TMEM256/DUF423 family)
MNWLVVAAIFGALGVVTGAFGAHGLRSHLTGEGAARLLESWKTAVDYHLFHSLALLALGLFQSATGRSVQLPGLLFAVGILLFSGSIYLLVLTPWRWLGPVTPLGGLCLIGAWLSLLLLAREG